MCSGMDLIDPKELESMRHQLEDAQRWNASLQARLGAIQSRGGGVGGANDGGKRRKTIFILSFQSFADGRCFFKCDSNFFRGNFEFHWRSDFLHEYLCGRGA